LRHRVLPTPPIWKQDW